MRVLQIANYRESKGGISIQVKLLQDKLRQDGLECDILSTKGTPVQRIKAIIKLFSIGSHYDVFHIHACSERGFFPAIVGMVAGKCLRKRTVLTYHGGGAKPFFDRHPRLVKYVLSRTSANIVLSGFTGQLFDSYGIPYTIIPNIVELDAKHFRDRDIIHPYLISTRTLSETYNIECTLRAFANLKARIPEATLTIVGDGPSRSNLEAFVQSNNIKDVIFAGHVNNEDIYGWLDQADILVSSSRADNMPVSILEGFNAGLLVIASNVGGVPYMIRDGETGYLFESNNDDQLVNKLILALQEQDKSRRIIQNAQESTSSYQWEKCKPLLYKLYKEENATI